MQKWIYVIILLTGYSIRSYTQKTINLNIPVEQNWMFDNEHPVRFMLELTSAQSGFSDRIRMDIATDFGNAVSSTFITYSFGTDSIAPGGGFRSRASVTLTNLTPGFYQVCFIAGTDTLKHFFFGYEAEQILSKPDGPPDLKRFWNKTITELKRVHPAYKMTRLPESSKPERDVYEVEMRSLEGEILRGYWAVPTDGQSHPAVVVYQGYDAVTWIPSPDDYPGWCILVIPPVDKASTNLITALVSGLLSDWIHPNITITEVLLLIQSAVLILFLLSHALTDKTFLLQVFRKVERSH